MRSSQCLLQQHIGEMFMKHWKWQGKRVVRDNGSLALLKKRGHQVVDVLELIKDKPKMKYELPVLSDTRLSIKHSIEGVVCTMYEDHNVLLEGLPQAKVLTNTVEPEEGVLSDSVQSLFSRKPVPLQDELVQRIIKSSLLYDAYQEKLPKRTDPERPAWNFPRDYGITDRRRNLLLTNRLVELCGISDPNLFPRRRILSDAPFRLHLSRQGGTLQMLMPLRADILLTSDSGLPAQTAEVNLSDALPDLGPLLPYISMEKKSVVDPGDVFPIKSLKGLSSKDQIHTALVHYDSTEVANIYETEVTEIQVLGRSLMKSYVFAGVQAKHNYGKDILDLPKPVVVQCVQTDGRLFHFSVFQLNTLREASDGGVCNVFWSLPRIPLYETCAYVSGKPVLEGYNPDVFRYLEAFYKNS